MKDLGYRVDRANRVVDGLCQAKVLRNLALLMAACLCLVYGLAAVVVPASIFRWDPNLNADKRHESFDNSYRDIAKATLPDVQGWFRSLHVDDKWNPLNLKDQQRKQQIPNNETDDSMDDDECVKPSL